MKIEKIEGVIIKSNKYLENSKIIYLFTKQGMVSLLAKGAYKLTSKNTSYTQNITKVSLDYTKGKGFDIITTGNILDNYLNIKTDYERLQTVYLISELIIHFSEHVSDNDLLYDFSIQIFDKLNNDECYKAYYYVFALKLLYLLGVGPEFTRCVNCQTKDNLKGFDFNSGGMICTNCANNSELFYDSDIIKKIKYLYLTKMGNFSDEILKSLEDSNEINLFIKNYYEQYLSFKSRTSNIIKKISH